MASQQPNAHLAWSTYVAWQATQSRISASAALARPATLRAEPETATTERLAWPLPATRQANAHLWWAEWVAQQRAQLARPQTASERAERFELALSAV